jgi:hypothetical protein
MAKQSPTDPKFRCNVCKEYYSAPEHLVYFQCPIHGILCKEHAFFEDNMEFYTVSKPSSDFVNKNAVESNKEKSFSVRLDEIKNIVFPYNQESYRNGIGLKDLLNVKFDAPLNYLNKCKCYKEDDFKGNFLSFPVKIVSDNKNSTKDLERRFSYKRNPELKLYSLKDFKGMLPEAKMEIVYLKPCLKKLIRFDWNNKVHRWLEFGREVESDFKETPRNTNEKSGNSEIRLLVELFSKNILSKEEFIEQILNKI